MIKACIFDLDGVIVDTARFHLIAWNQIANEFDYNLSSHDNESLKGVSRMASLDFILDLAGKSKTIEEKMALAEKKNLIYQNMIKQIDRSEMLPGVLSFIEELQEAGIKIGLGSASKNATFILTQLELLDYFKIIVDGNSVINSKPHPEVFNKGALGLEENPADIVVFEDSAKGIEAAIAGGFKIVGIGNEEDLKNADFVIKGFDKFNLETLNYHYQ